MCGISRVLKINRQAMEAANNGNYELAVSKMNEALSLIQCESKKAHKAKLYMNLALIYNMFEKTDESKKSYKLAIKNLNPFNKGQSILIGRIQERITEMGSKAA